MPESAAAIVRRMFERHEQGGVDAVLDLLAPDAAFVVGPETSAEPDVYEGHDGARRYFAGFEGALDEVRFELVEILESTADRVLASVRLSGYGSATRIHVEQAVLMTVTVRAGAVTRIVTHASLESAQREIAGGS